MSRGIKMMEQGFFDRCLKNLLFKISITLPLFTPPNTWEVYPYIALKCYAELFGGGLLKLLRCLSSSGKSNCPS